MKIQFDNSDKDMSRLGNSLSFTPCGTAGPGAAQRKTHATAPAEPTGTRKTTNGN